ncbi:hypothetical protein J1N35_027694 [Gossypium stocksii]|uniref:Uncharacterized protein n=1 Tax=Gossypium stocksii TaxID=47602 RepID=A0A9D3VC12_9ROSI|nr:hypothetical protein J1N35_027694 [Gossypium stocksii]
MEEWEQKCLINELLQGRELAMQLQAHLNLPPCNETRELLLQQIQASYDKALSLLNYKAIGTSDMIDPPPQSLPVRDDASVQRSKTMSATVIMRREIFRLRHRVRIRWG